MKTPKIFISNKKFDIKKYSKEKEKSKTLKDLEKKLLNLFKNY